MIFYKNIKGVHKMNREIPVFFTIDNSYAPYLAVALNSAIKNANPDRKYKAIILHEGLTQENIDKIKAFETDNFKIDIQTMQANFESLDDRMSNRLRCDYFTLTIYFRLFIPELYPQYDKALYLDGDIVILSDIADLYNIDIGDNLVGGATDEVIQSSEAFKEYCIKLGEEDTMLALKKISPSRLAKNALYNKIKEAEDNGADATTLKNILGDKDGIYIFKQ